MLKKIILPVFCLFMVFPLMAKEKPLSYFINKYELPANVNILSVFGSDCINCYYGFSMFLKAHEADFKKRDFVFLFQKNANGEIDNIFKYQLGLNKADCSVIVDDNFYAAVDKIGATTLTIVEDKKAREKFTSKDIYKFTSFAGINPSEIVSLTQTDTIDLKGRFGTKKLSIDVINESKMLIHNNYTNDIFLFDIANKKIVKTLPLTFFTEKYDSLLTLLLSDKPQELAYNLENYKGNEFYKTFPLCKIRHISSINGQIYIGIAVSRMTKDENGHINYDGIQALVKMDSTLTMQHIYKIPVTFTGVDGKYLSLSDFSFINDETIFISMSSVGDRKKDSVATLYSLKTNEMKIIDMSYDSFMPMKGPNGYYMYYHFDVWKDSRQSLKANFTRSPYIFDVATKAKTLLPGLGIDPKTIEPEGKDKYFWISKIFPYNNSMFVLCYLKQTEALLLQYDADFKTLLSKKKIYNGYLNDTFLFNNTLFSFEDYSEKGDVAVLHTYKLK